MCWDILTQLPGVLFTLWLRTDGTIAQGFLLPALQYGLSLTLLRPLLFWRSGLYRQMWRYARYREARLLVGTSVMASLCNAMLFYALLMPTGLVATLPRSLPVIECGVSLVLAAMPRLLLQMASHRMSQLGRTRDARAIPTLIIGAGEAGARVVDEIRSNPQLPYQVVALVDDDPAKQGLALGKYQVQGTTADIPRLAARYGVHQAIVAMPSASGKAIRRINEICVRAGLDVLTLPSTSELISGDVAVSRLRKVQIDDLLRREPVRIDRAQVAAFICGRRVLVTGGGGSIGSELCRQICECRPARLTVLGHGENSLYLIREELLHRYPDLAIDYVVADIRDSQRLARVFAGARPEIVFHAAAHKHVPLMEDNVPDAVTNNVQGTRNVLNACLTYGVQRFLMISTDKAVNPTSTMGVTKRVAELLVQDAARKSGRAYVAVRFGNVLGSRGSVVPLFRAQIEAGGPVTVTHPEMKRYFMTIPEAVALVLQAACLGSGGETFVLDMGEPVRIVDLARDLIRLSGLRPDEDVAIEYVGLRPGEKLFEELTLDTEHYAPSPHPKVYVLRDQPEHRAAALDGLDQRVDALVAMAAGADDDTIRAKLKEIVPEYLYCPAARQQADASMPAKRILAESLPMRPPPAH